MTTYTINEAKKGIEISFDSIPNIETRSELKSNGFRWHPKNKYWYAKETTTRLKLVKKLCNNTEPSEKKAEDEIKNKYGVKIGDVFACSWGYEQTQTDFFQVIKLVGKQSVRIVGVLPPIIERESLSSMSEDRFYKIGNGELLPVDERNVFIKDSVNGDLKRLKTYNNSVPCICIDSYATAHLCTGETVKAYESWYY